MDNNLTYIEKKLREGDTDIYIFLFRQFYVPLCAYARRYVGRKDIAEEIVSETFFNIWKNRENLHVTTSVKSYLFQAVSNNAISYLRKIKKEEGLISLHENEITDRLNLVSAAEDIPSESLIMKDLIKTIDMAVDSLPAQQQKVFRLKRYDGKKNREIAEIMGISVKTVEMHLSKALLSLRRSLKEYLPEFLFFLLINFFSSAM